ncbi:hypothetical protein [Tannerella sp.]|uniref:hypothetical protein n=1 Tax=Tannerella sp. TaxID=2382127 RepID=UPI0026DB2165|nr:hypothetical protein [Tannerella sp.]MDO4703769.1 hypothetical protein [Tannerella sp.]
MSLRHSFVIRYIPVIMQLLLFSCGDASRDRQLLHEAGMLSDSLPADALTKLQAVNKSERFTKPDYAKYEKIFVDAGASKISVFMLPFSGAPAVAWTQDFAGNMIDLKMD